MSIGTALKVGAAVFIGYKVIKASWDVGVIFGVAQADINRIVAAGYTREQVNAMNYTQFVQALEKTL